VALLMVWNKSIMRPSSERGLGFSLSNERLWAKAWIKKLCTYGQNFQGGSRSCELVGKSRTRKKSKATEFVRANHWDGRPQMK